MEQVGYARVSTREERQVFDRQIDALRVAGCHRIFDDRGSGANTDRPGLNSPLLKSRFGQPGSAVTAMTRMANPSGDTAMRMIAAVCSVWTNSR
jgi:predicted site-specific integrase-resolvase